MITGELKNKIDSLWEIFWTGGLTNPLDVIEQMTYLMFIHDLDDADNTHAKESAMLGLPYESVFAKDVQLGDKTIDGTQLKWSVFHDFPAERMYSVMQEMVFPFIKNLHSNKDSAYSKYMDDAIFKIPTPLMLSKVVDSMDDLYEQMSKLKDTDARGDVYEYLLSKIATAGVNGQFRTPRHIIKMMVELMQLQADETICDPACGTGGFLVASEEWLRANRKEEIFFDKDKKEHFMNHMFTGFDMDRTMLRIGAMNMMTHGVDNPFIEYRDSLSDQNPDMDKFSLILANPPFKGSLDYDIVSADLLKVCKTKKTELLFLALFVRMLKVGGRCACIVPDGVLFGSSTAHKAIRKELIENQRLEAIISMPSGVFKPYAGVSTGILIFTKTNHGGTDNVWFYDMQADGFSLDDKRAEVKENDIPDIIERFRNRDKELDRERTEKSFMVPKQEIVDNGYDLSINKYKKVEYVAVEYPPTEEIMANIRKLEMEIGQEMDELEELLKL
ncbi:MAG: type I restriction-modification system subunit M [Butyrivibrio sp.]|jgi:type I restriction enzyme M protein|nr:type I restriction-modification system subunit M [Butyrivibrio sp.]